MFEDSRDLNQRKLLEFLDNLSVAPSIVNSFFSRFDYNFYQTKIGNSNSRHSVHFGKASYLHI